MSMRFWGLRESTTAEFNCPNLMLKIPGVPVALCIELNGHSSWDPMDHRPPMVARSGVAPASVPPSPGLILKNLHGCAIGP
eukprot:1296240-Amphidinium_carterae.1